MKSEIDVYVTEAVRKRREELEMSQEALSFKIGRASSWVSNVECGNKKYNVTHLYLIALALRCSVNDFFPDKPVVISKQN